MGTISRRFLVSLRTLSPSLFDFTQNPNSSSLALSLLHLRSIFSNSNQNPQPQTQTPSFPYPYPKTRTPLEKQFETWITKLKPGFTPDDVNVALQSQCDPDLALDIFRWAAQQRTYRHNHITYHTMIQMAINGKRWDSANTLLGEVIAGACEGSVQLYNVMVGYCCSKRTLFARGFDVYKIMLRSQDCKPNLETFSMLLKAVLAKFSKMNVCYVYLHAVRSLHRQMKVSGVIPDVMTLNLIIKAYSLCLEMDGAIRVFREMGLYGCEPNGNSYSYVAKGLCEKGLVNEGVGYYNEMRDKGLVGASNCYVIVICSLSMERRFEEAIKIMFDMLDNNKAPDPLTYKTVLEGLCREGRGDDAFDLLEEWRNKDRYMSEKTYNNLLNELRFMNR
ncbi:hypothetical protein GIB67_026327 [Kingdonia uniflora]|uniref:Death domain-containing protein n=1 Tax=Kingdonia uniflora TaxID=39325 RepID=A0A7J7N5K0_9MAGN|nr:hypothetical protein GIB67_026327 [Kingdonia uniflora]